MFEKLYKEFMEECSGTVYMMVNDSSRYKKWYKKRVEQLCIDYNNSTAPDIETPPCGEDKTCSGCSEHGECEWVK